MDGFSKTWLALREPADHAARSTTLTRVVLDVMADDPAPRILDLAAGTGSNLRYLAEQIADAHWLLVDHDPALLARVEESPRVETRVMDLASPDDIDSAIFDGRALVTASALLDLVSEPWLRALAAACARQGSAVLFALSYDGSVECTPEDHDDAQMIALVNEHQRTDKGFGPALGPGATDAAERGFAAVGYRIERARSEWILTPELVELQRQLLDGWAQAATGMAPQQARAIDAWHERRLAHLAAGWSTIIVGHEDLIGIFGSTDLRT